jgi:hypothetical protein
MTGNFLTTSRQLLPRNFLSPNSFKEQNYFKDEYFHDEILNCQESGSAISISTFHYCFASLISHRTRNIFLIRIKSAKHPAKKGNDMKQTRTASSTFPMHSEVACYIRFSWTAGSDSLMNCCEGALLSSWF